MVQSEVENEMSAQSIAHPEAVERQRLHTAVSFNRSKFLRWGLRYDGPNWDQGDLIASEKILQSISTGILSIVGCT